MGDQMKDLMNDPNLMANAMEGMKAAQEMYNNPDALNDMMADIMKELTDEEIEDVRQMLVTGGGDPMMKELLGDIDDSVLKDPVAWRKTVKEGLGMLGGA